MVTELVDNPFRSAVSATVESLLLSFDKACELVRARPELSVITSSIIASGHDRIAQLCDEFLSCGDLESCRRILHDIAQPVAGIKLALHSDGLDLSQDEQMDCAALLDALVDVLTDVAVAHRARGGEGNCGGSAASSSFLWELCRRGGRFADARGVGLWGRSAQRSRPIHGLEACAAALCRQMMYRAVLKANGGRVLMAFRIRNGVEYVEMWAYAEEGLRSEDAYEGVVAFLASACGACLEEVSFGETLAVCRFPLGQTASA